LKSSPKDPKEEPEMSIHDQFAAYFNNLTPAEQLEEYQLLESIINNENEEETPKENKK
jgi:hypothetical protein